VTHLATAAILLLTLVSGLLMARPQPTRLQEPAASLPALVSSPATTRELVTTTRFEATIDNVPAGATAATLEQWEFTSNAALTMVAASDAHWIIAIKGSFAVAVDGVASTLTMGEGLVVPADQELVVESTSETAALLHGGVMPMYPPRHFDSRVLTYRTLIHSAATMPGGAIRVIMERVTVAPGTTLPTFLLRDNEWVGIGAGSVGVMLEGERLPLYWHAGEERAFAFPSSFPHVTPGTRVTLRNVADDQLVLYHMSVIAGDAAAEALSLGVPGPPGPIW
jgi:hypothetical protein